MGTSRTLRITAAEQRRRLHDSAELLRTRVRRTAPTYLVSGIIIVGGLVGLVVGYKLVSSRRKSRRRR
jgi:hypothetical protein